MLGRPEVLDRGHLAQDFPIVNAQKTKVLIGMGSYKVSLEMTHLFFLL